MACLFSSQFESLEELLESRAPGQAEFHQAVLEIADDICPLMTENQAYQDANLFERIIEPERVIMFKIAWQNDQGKIEVNRGYRVQFNGAIGPYKGGLRFHPSVNLSILKFLGFEQTLKNSLTGQSMGGAKGGSDFNPKGRSDAEIMRFCNAFMQELQHYIHPDIDVPAGDINVGSREIGYLFGAYRRFTHQFAGVLSGKSLSFGGSQLRTEATGYGVVYFLQEMLKANNDSLDGKTILISGAGNVATYTAEKAIELGAKVLSLSDSKGTIYDEAGFTSEKIQWVRQYKREHDSSLKAYADKFNAQWTSQATPWSINADIAIPCATQNEMNAADAKHLVDNNIQYIVEGANMPLTAQAKQVIQKAQIPYAPGKAANAGGVAVSGMEMSQNRSKISYSREKVELALKKVMQEIHTKCQEEGQTEAGVNYSRGANRAGFRKVADAMMAQGVG